MSVPTDDGTLEVHGCFFHYDGEDFWFWDEKQWSWTVLHQPPSYLVVVNGRLAVIDIDTGRPKCNCSHQQVVNFGCKCGGV